MKKALTLILALLMILSVATASGTLDLNNLTETVTISVYSNAQNRPARDLEDDYIRQQLQQDLNIDLQLVCMPTDDYYTSLNLMISSGSIPDIFLVNSTQYENFAQAGLLLDLKPYLDLMPNYTTAFENIGEDASILYDDALYIIGTKNQRPASMSVPSYQSMWIRKDWLDNLGLSVPTTLDEFYDVCYAFTYDDPDGNGIDDTYGFSGLRDGFYNQPSMYAFIYGAYGVGDPTSYIIQDGDVILSAEAEETKDALAFVNKLTSAGVVDPDLLSYSNYNQFNETIYNNKVGIIYYSWAVFIKSQFGDQLRQLCPDAEWVHISPFTGPDGDAYMENYRVPGLVSSGYVVSAQVAEDETKLARVLKYLDYISDGDGLNLVSYGIEGKHFTIGDDGSIIVDVSKASETENAYQHQICSRKELQYLLTKFPDISEEIEFAAAQPRIDDYYNFVPTIDGLNKADWERNIFENIVKFMYGTRSLDEYDSFIETLYKIFGQEQYNDAVRENLKDVGIL